MTALISTTRVESVGVNVGVGVAVAVGVSVGVNVVVAVGVSVNVGACIGVEEGVSEGSTINVGSAAVERPIGLNSKYSAVPHVTKHNATMTNKNRRIHHLRSLVAETQRNKCGVSNLCRITVLTWQF
jgi:hypothetical protein